MKEPVKVMLHPVRAPRLRTVTAHIDSNVAGSCSWRRLVEVLRSAGELKLHEEVEAFVLDDEGLNIYVRKS